MPLKITLFYNQYQEGWTETYYALTPSDPVSFFQLFTPKTFFPFVSFRHSSVNLYGVRASVIGSPRTSLTYVFTGQTAMSGTPIVGDTADVSAIDAFTEFYGPNTVKRPLYIRGLNEQDIVRDANGVSTPTPNLTKGIQGMINAMGKMTLCIQAIIRPPNLNLVWNQIVGVQPGPSPGLASLLLNQPFLPQPVPGVTQVSFTGVPKDDLPGFPRTAVVQYFNGGPTTFSITIPYRVRAYGTLPYEPSKLRACQLLYQYYPITYYTFIKFGERKTGRPIGLSRGRTRPAVRAQ